MIIYETRDELIKKFDKNIKICEIGVFMGEFSKKIFKELTPSELHLIDIFEGEMCSGDKDGNNIIWTNLEQQYTLLKNHFNNNNNVHIHKGKSYEVLNNFDDYYFDIVYIDGDHSYDGVKKDLAVSFQKVKPNGLICGHDYTVKMFEGVVRAVDEFCVEKNLSIKYLTNDGCPSYCIVKK